MLCHRQQSSLIIDNFAYPSNVRQIWSALSCETFNSQRQSRRPLGLLMSRGLSAGNVASIQFS